MSRMPVMFVGHGSPMNAIEDNVFTKEWEQLKDKIEKPKAILVVSAHWYTSGTKILNIANPKTIYDMYGFPDELYQVVYNAPGNQPLARQCKKLIDQANLDEEWGFDHGAWSVLCRMYPEAKIPVIQISIDYNLSAQQHFDFGRQLSVLRNEGVLIIGSGNIVHNLGILDWSKEDGYDWAYEFDKEIKDTILNYDYEKIINYQNIPNQKNAFKYLDHYLPLMYVMGTTEGNEKIEVFNEACINGSLSMTSYLFK